MGKRILVDPVTMYQPASGCVKNQSAYHNSRHVRTEGSVPDVPGHSPWGKKLCNVRRDFQRRSPHVSPPNAPSRHVPTPSTPRTIRQGSATADPAPGGTLSCECPGPSTLWCHRRHKNPVHCSETPCLFFLGGSLIGDTPQPTSGVIGC